MHEVAVVRGSGAVCRRSNERVGELDTPTDSKKTGVHRRRSGDHADPERLAGTMQQHGVAERIRGRGQDEQLRVGRQMEESPGIALFDLAGHGLTDGEPEAAGETRRVPCTRQFEEGEWVAVALSDDLVADGHIERAIHVVQQQGTCITVVEPTDLKLG